MPFFVMKSALFVQANVAVNTKLTSKVPFLFVCAPPPQSFDASYAPVRKLRIDREKYKKNFDVSSIRPSFETWKFFSCIFPVWKVCITWGRNPHTLLMLSIYLLLNFRNLPRAISKLSSQGIFQTQFAERGTNAPEGKLSFKIKRT